MANKNAIGYACQIIGAPRVSLRSCTLARATRETLTEIAVHNLAALASMAEYNSSAGIRLFRISSDIIPLASHPDVAFDWRRLFAGELAEVGRKFSASGQRVSMHPGQYTVLNSPDEGVAERAARDLAYHADFLDLLGAPSSSRIILHVGGVYGNRRDAVKRFEKRCSRLPENIRARLALENDERSYAIDEVHALCRSLELPAVLDVLHFALLPPAKGGVRHWLEQCAGTWKPADGRQKIHYSQQAPGGRPGSHSRTIDGEEFARFHSGVSDLPLDVMLEVKDKNLSAMKCIDCVAGRLPRSRLTEAWARYKYSVLERDPAKYGAVREYLKSPSPDAAGFYRLIDEAMAEYIEPGRAVNAAEHVWGYFSRDASPADARRYQSLVSRLKGDAGALPAVKRFLLKKTVEAKNDYLWNSLYFDL